MIFPSAAPEVPQPKPVTMADGQTFSVLVVRPNYHQRFEDEGRQLRAYAGQPDAWADYKLYRIRSAIVDWADVTNDKNQPIPFTTQRLFTLMDAAPEVASQLEAIATEAFRPLAQASVKSDVPQGGSGKGDQSTPSPTSGESSASTATAADSDGSPSPSDQQSGS